MLIKFHNLKVKIKWLMLEKVRKIKYIRFYVFKLTNLLQEDLINTVNKH
jgi:hypothetical protein